MINKLKIGLIATGLSLALGALPVVALATDALTYSSDTDVYINNPGYTLTIKSGSTATTVALSATALQITMPISATFTLASRNNIDITTNAGAATTSTTCSGTLNTLVITTSASQSTYDATLTPNGGICAASSGGGGGGGGGGSYYVAPTYVAPATPATPAVPTVSPAVPATPASASSLTTGVYNLGTVTLKNGSKGEPVKELQRALNKILNLGLAVDGKLGPKTIAVIKTWQKAHKLVPDGLIGAKTKAAMKAEAEKK
jgi:hypothetical protein